MWAMERWQHTCSGSGLCFCPCPWYRGRWRTARPRPAMPTPGGPVRVVPLQRHTPRPRHGLHPLPPQCCHPAKRARSLSTNHPSGRPPPFGRRARAAAGPPCPSTSHLPHSGNSHRKGHRPGGGTVGRGAAAAPPPPAHPYLPRRRAPAAEPLQHAHLQSLPRPLPTPVTPPGRARRQRHGRQRVPPRGQPAGRGVRRPKRAGDGGGHGGRVARCAWRPPCGRGWGVGQPASGLGLRRRPKSSRRGDRAADTALPDGMPRGGRGGGGGRGTHAVVHAHRGAAATRPSGKEGTPRPSLVP